jgi:hypothetical protein
MPQQLPGLRVRTPCAESSPVRAQGQTTRSAAPPNTTAILLRSQAVRSPAGSVHGGALRPIKIAPPVARPILENYGCTKGLSYGSSFCGNENPCAAGNFIKEYSRYTFKKSAPLSKEEGTPEIISRPPLFLKKHATRRPTKAHRRQAECTLSSK